MKEYGMLKIRKKIPIENIHEGIKEIVKDPVFEEYAFNTGNYIDDEGYIVVINWKIHLGKDILLTLCKNMKGNISMIHIRYRNVEEKVLKKLVDDLENLTNGKFHAG